MVRNLEVASETCCTPARGRCAGGWLPGCRSGARVAVTSTHLYADANFNTRPDTNGTDGASHVAANNGSHAHLTGRRSLRVVNIR
jgi:hypothetical protein